MSNSFVLERLQAEHWRRYRAIRLESLADAPDAFARTLAEERAFDDAVWRRRLTGPSATFVGVVGGRDVAVATGAARRDDARAAGLFGMWVAPTARARGVGRAIIGAVVDWARSEGFAQLTLEVADRNVAAVELYASMGFAPTGRVGAMPAPRSHISEHERALSLERPAGATSAEAASPVTRS